MKLENYEVHLPNYSIGDAIYDKIGPVCESYGKTVLVIGGKRALDAAFDKIKAAVDQTNLEIIGKELYGKDCTYQTVEKLRRMSVYQKADMVFGVGGGKALDTVKCLCITDDKPVFSFPTIASNCSACTSVSIMYNEDGTFLKPNFFVRPVMHAFIDTEIIAKAPSQYMWAGIGDTYAKYYEATISSRDERLEHFTSLGVAVSLMCRNPLLEYGPKAFAGHKKGLCTYDVEQEIATSADGKLKAVTWQATPGLFAYRRSIAKDVLGTDDPDAVQEALADWDKFNAVAEQAAAKGYYMLSGYDDAYRTFSNNVSAPWVADDGETVVVDANLMKWVDQTKTYTDKGYNHKSSLWDATWAADQGPTGKVFGFFYSTWGINFTLLGNSLETSVANGGKEEVGNGAYGDYAVCQGPQAYYWGGTWICAAAGTDNVATIKDVMQKLTCDAAIAKKITEDTQDYTNNVAAMNELAQNYSSAFLGGQNHIALFAEAAPKIDMSNISAYDQGLNESFQGAFKNYFDGNATIDEAKAQFESIISEKYPELVNFQWPDAE